LISLADFARLAAEFPAELAATVEPLRIGDQVFSTGDQPLVMGCVNLSKDSTYRESIAMSAGSAIRRGQILHAQGAGLVDVGAESTTASACRVTSGEQSATLIPVVRGLSEAGVPVSAEGYDPEVIGDCLAAGAQVVNYTGSEDEEKIFDLVAAHRATIILCFTRGANVRDVAGMTVDDDPLPMLTEYFTARVARARDRGVERIIIDPGMGFYYANLVDPRKRIHYQTQVLLHSFRLRTLGLPICNALPHAQPFFEDQYRIAEGFFAVLAALGRTDVLRTHETAQVVAVRAMLSELNSR